MVPRVTGIVSVVTGVLTVETTVVAGVVLIVTVVTAVVACVTVVTTALTPNPCEKPGVARNPIMKAVIATAKTAYATYRAALPLAGTLCCDSTVFSGTVTQPELA